MPQTRQMKPIEALASPEALQAWAAQRLDLVIEGEAAARFLGYIQRFLAHVKQWHDEDTQIGYLKWGLIHMSQESRGGQPPFPRPLANPHRVCYYDDASYLPSGRLHDPESPRFGRNFMTEEEQLCWRRREDFLGQLAVDEILL